MTTPYTEGRLAFHAPKITDCPYTLDSKDYWEWWRGLRNAERMAELLPHCKPAKKPAKKPVNLRKMARRIKALEKRVIELERIVTKWTGD